MNVLYVLRSSSRHLLLKFLIISLFFLSVFFYFTNPINTITDFWWHISTGKWIAENSELPQDDPFSYTAAHGPDAQKAIILKGYWISQVCYYIIYKTVGWSGLIVFKGTLFALIFGVLWRILVMKGVEPISSLAIISPALIVAKSFEYIRPHTFSFLFALVLFYFVERGLAELRKTDIGKTRTVIFFPAIMVVWANLHPGYIVGIGMIGIYAFSETIKYMRKKGSLSSASYKRLMLWLALSILASCINPNNIMPVISPITLFGYGPIQNTDEYKQTWQYYSANNELFRFYWLSVIAFVTSIVMIRSWRKVELAHILLYGCFAVAGMVYFRFSIFFALMSIAISAQYLSRPTGPVQKLLPRVATAITILVVVLTAAYSFRHSFIAAGTLPSDSPSEASDFIMENNLPGPLFNPYEWGGYLIWKLYPRYQVFVDGRSLDVNQFYESLTVSYGRKDEIFGKYGIKTVIYYYLNVQKDGIPGLIYSLLGDDQWKMVFTDRKVAVVFVRADAAPYIASLSKEWFTDVLIQKAMSWAERAPNNAKACLMLGQLYRVKNDFAKADYYYRETLRLDPGNVFAAYWIRNSGR